LTTSSFEYVLATILLQTSNRTVAKLNLDNRFDVIGGVSDAEMGRLRDMPSEDRPFIVMTWIHRLVGHRMSQGGLNIPPPILARTYQIFSEVVTSAQQAHKLALTPFPYPLRQLLALLLLAFQVLVPMCVAAFVDSPPLVATLCFFVCLGYMSLNEVARELEHPFGLGANHLPVVAYQDSLNSKLSRLLDLWQPELGYIPTKSRAGSEADISAPTLVMREHASAGLDSANGAGAPDALGSSNFV